MQSLLLLLAFSITRHEPISFNSLVKDIKLTAQQSNLNDQVILKTYKHVFGDIDGSNTIDIGELVIEFDHTRQYLDISKFKDKRIYLKVLVNCRQQTGRIQAVRKIPNELSGRQQMIFTNSLLSALKVKKVQLADAASIDYAGCNGQTEQVSLTIFRAIIGKRKGWYENFGYINRRDQTEIAMLMRAIHEYPLPSSLQLKDKSIVIFTGTQTLGETMSYYWNNDKCIFSEIYSALKNQGVFTKLMNEAGGIKIRRFIENEDLPPTNMFIDSN